MRAVSLGWDGRACRRPWGAVSFRAPSLLLSAALLTGALVQLAGPAAADTGPVPLGLSSLGRIVVDDARGHLFLTSGPSGSGVRVTDLQGGPVRTIDGLPGATGLALTPDGSSLWVAVPSMGLARIDTSTLAVAQRSPCRRGSAPATWQWWGPAWCTATPATPTAGPGCTAGSGWSTR